MSTSLITPKVVLTLFLSLVFLLIAQSPLAGNGDASQSQRTRSFRLDHADAPSQGPVVVHRSLAARHRLELRMGFWDSGTPRSLPAGTFATEVTRVEDLVGAFSYAYWVHDQLATDVTIRGLVADATSIERTSGKTENVIVIASAMFGVRCYPFLASTTPLRPHISAGVGPYVGVESHKRTYDDVVEETKTLSSFGGYVGTGFDIQMGRHLMAAVNVGYNAMVDFPEPLGLKKNYSGVELSAGIGVLLGKGVR